jgi:hypothetical protein
MTTQASPVRRRLGQLFALFVTAAAAWPSHARAQTNLLNNGNAEAGSLAGWTDPIAHGYNVSTASYSGAYAFTGGISGPAASAWNNELRQDVDVSASAAAIDANSVTSTFSGRVRSNEAGGATDTGRIVLEFLSAAGGTLQSFDSGVLLPTNTWLLASDVRIVPPGTRTLRVRLLGHRDVGASTDSSFDELDLRIDCGANTYCTAKTNSLGCLPAMSFAGTPSSTASSFVVNATRVLNNKTGLLFWGRVSNATAFQGGFLCAQPPTLRTPTQSSGGNPTGDDCSGQYAFAWSAVYMSTNGLTAGDDVYCEFWSRDPASASTTGLTDAVHFRVCP